jgi:hypothetical protein
MTETTTLSAPQITQAKRIRNWNGYGKRRLGIISLNFIISLDRLKKIMKKTSGQRRFELLTFCDFRYGFFYCP